MIKVIGLILVWGEGGCVDGRVRRAPSSREGNETYLVDPAVVGRGEKAKNLWENACIKVHDVMGRLWNETNPRISLHSAVCKGKEGV